MCLPVDGFIYGSNMVYMGTILMVSRKSLQSVHLSPTVLHLFGSPNMGPSSLEWCFFNGINYPQQVFGCELFNGLVKKEHPRETLAFASNLEM